VKIEDEKLDVAVRHRESGDSEELCYLCKYFMNE
jgi:hypothetical protein